MNSLLLEHSKNIDTKQVMELYKELQEQYCKEGITKENLCSVVMRVLTEVNKYKKLSEDERKEIIISILNKLIRNIDEGANDSDIEVLLMSLVPNLVDSVFFAINSSNKLKQLFCCMKA